MNSHPYKRWGRRSHKFCITLAALMFPLGLLPNQETHAQPSPDWSRAECDVLAESARTVTRDGLPPRQALIDRPADVDRQLARETDFDEIAFILQERARACDALFVAIVQDKFSGRISPSEVDASWRLAPTAYDLELLRTQARDSIDLAAFLNALGPQDEEYQLMREALAALEAASATTDAMQSRRTALVASLERRRWTSQPWPARYLLVEVPFFEARLMEGARTIDRWNVIVGARRTPTPSFVANASGVTLNPFWTPPSQIVRNEILPLLRRNPNAAKALGYRALDATGAPVDVDWRQRPFPYRVVQTPGPRNALGRVKIEMPNPFAIYLHDTPNKALFARSARALSHGCIRVKDPERLALALLAPSAWDKTALSAAIATNVNLTIPLAAPVPIFVLYRTVRLGDDGALQYADDIYRRDRKLVATIERGRASPLASATATSTECGSAFQ